MHGRALVCKKHHPSLLLDSQIGLDAYLAFQSVLGVHSNPNGPTRNGKCDHIINNHPSLFYQVLVIDLEAPSNLTRPPSCISANSPS